MADGDAFLRERAALAETRLEELLAVPEISSAAYRAFWDSCIRMILGRGGADPAYLDYNSCRKKLGGHMGLYLCFFYTTAWLLERWILLREGNDPGKTPLLREAGSPGTVTGQAAAVSDREPQKGILGGNAGAFSDNRLGCTDGRAAGGIRSENDSGVFFSLSEAGCALRELAIQLYVSDRDRGGPEALRDDLYWFCIDYAELIAAWQADLVRGGGAVFGGSMLLFPSLDRPELAEQHREDAALYLGKPFAARYRKAVESLTGSFGLPDSARKLWRDALLAGCTPHPGSVPYCSAHQREILRQMALAVWDGEIQGKEGFTL